ncbi:ribonuclease Z [Porphyromonas endodontalis ATCC 35406]|uniref:Ribonuclease Z n=2 Tax=Porphyromonas endodontalis TaxID=28124 RepID=C3JB21_POREA|nr:ribonuclease Z [Porphyromonas endodontalis ATCC 35406]
MHPMETLSVHILGCGSALPTTKHNPSAQALTLRGKVYLVDCGEGTQLQIRRQGLHFGRIHTIFISHLHGDHCFGLPGLLSTLSMLGRTGELHIHGPEGLTEYIDAHRKSFLAECSYEIITHEHDYRKSEVIHEDPSLCVRSLPLSHRIPTMGFLFEERCAARHLDKPAVDFYQVPRCCYPAILLGESYTAQDGSIIPNNRLTKPGRIPRRYAYCSDTEYFPDLIEQVRGVDLLYHEATFGEDLRARLATTAHSTARDAATIALKAEVKRLLIGHYSSRYTDVTPLLDEARSVFPNTTAAQEGLIIHL